MANRLRNHYVDPHSVVSILLYMWCLFLLYVSATDGSQSMLKTDGDCTELFRQCELWVIFHFHFEKFTFLSFWKLLNFYDDVFLPEAVM